MTISNRRTEPALLSPISAYARLGLLRPLLGSSGFTDFPGRIHPAHTLYFAFQAIGSRTSARNFQRPMTMKSRMRNNSYFLFRPRRNSAEPIKDYLFFSSST